MEFLLSDQITGSLPKNTPHFPSAEGYHIQSLWEYNVSCPPGHSHTGRLQMIQGLLPPRTQARNHNLPVPLLHLHNVHRWNNILSASFRLITARLWNSLFALPESPFLLHLHSLHTRFPDLHLRFGHLSFSSFFLHVQLQAIQQMSYKCTEPESMKQFFSNVLTFFVGSFFSPFICIKKVLNSITCSSPPSSAILTPLLMRDTRSRN